MNNHLKPEEIMKKDTKGLILLEAFKLFATHTYQQVTFDELEAKTGLTRGAIMYHFKTKELIFHSMCDKYLLEANSSLQSLKESVSPDTSLKKFIALYIQAIKDQKKTYGDIGIRNMSKVRNNIINQATYYYPSFEVKALKWQFIQVQMWRDVLEKAVSKGEIRGDLNLTTLSELFEDVYWGISNAGIAFPDGIEIERLKKAFDLLYSTIKQSK